MLIKIENHPIRLCPCSREVTSKTKLNSFGVYSLLEHMPMVKGISFPQSQLLATMLGEELLEVFQD